MNEKEKAEIAKLEAEIENVPESLKNAWANVLDLESLHLAMKAELNRVKPLIARIRTIRAAAKRRENR